MLKIDDNPGPAPPPPPRSTPPLPPEVLEHPEIQGPDFEGVLDMLFKLAARLTMERREALCSFLEGLEEERFSRCVLFACGGGTGYRFAGFFGGMFLQGVWGIQVAAARGQRSVV